MTALRHHPQMLHNANKSLERLAGRIENRAKDQAKPFIVAIDGRSGAGKSTLAGQIAQLLHAEILSGDDFFAGGEGVHAKSPQALAEMCVDWNAQRKVLACLKRCKNASFFPYDWGAFDGSKSTSKTVIQAHKIILFEGVYSTRPELRDLIDFCVLVEIPDQIRLSRLAKREGELSEWEMQWHRAEDWYFASLATQDTFDVVIADGELLQRSSTIPASPKPAITR